MIKNWIIAALLVLVVSIVKEPRDETCVVSMKDSYGHTHEFSGAVAKVSVN